MPKQAAKTDPDILFRVRTTKTLKRRVSRLAARKGCSTSDVIRGALLALCESEEARMGLNTKAA